MENYKKQMSNKIAVALLWVSITALICMNAILLQSITEDKSIVRVLGLLFFAWLVIFVNRKKITKDAFRCGKDSEIVYFITAALIDSTLSLECLKILSSTDIVSKLTNIIHVSAGVLSVLLVVLAGTVSYHSIVYILKLIFEDLLGINRDSLEEKQFLFKPAAIMAAIYSASIFTIIRANYIYKDDMQRITNGTTVYQRENRFLGELATEFLEGDTFFADISPVTQILEMVLIAIAVVILFYVVTEKKKFRVIDYIAMIPFGISPYFLECISFKYDAPQHGIAILMSVLPLLLYKSDRRKYRIFTAICIVCVCCSHQVAMALFPTFVLLLCLKIWNEGLNSNQKLKTFLFDSVIGYCTGILFFRLFLMHSISYNDGLSSILSLRDLVPGMLKNYGDFFLYITSDFDPKWLCMIAVITLSAMSYLIVGSKRSKGQSVVVTFIGIILMFAGSYSVYPLLVSPLHSPRHMYSFGILIGILSIAAVSLYEHRAIIAKSAVVFLAFSFFIFSVKYGNALNYQAEYTDYRVGMVVDKLSTMDIYQKNDKVITQITGGTGFSPVVEKMGESVTETVENPELSLMQKIKKSVISGTMVKRLVTTSFNEYFGVWYASDIYNLYGLDAYYNSECPDLRTLNLPLFEDNYYYTIYANEEYVLIDLKERSKTQWLEY